MFKDKTGLTTDMHFVSIPSFGMCVVDDYDEDMMLDEDELITPSPTGEEIFDDTLGRFMAQRGAPNVKIVDKNFFNGNASCFAFLYCGVLTKWRVVLISSKL
jgi:hypothetical protein